MAKYSPNCGKEERLTISITEAASRLGISRNTAYAAARAGQLPTIMIGRRILIPVSGLEKLLEDYGVTTNHQNPATHN